jgi:malate dehydrogenase
MSKITVVGAGKYGSATAQRLAEACCVDEVVLTDIVEGLPQGIALDMNQSRSVVRFRTKVIGTNDYDDTAGSEIVVITAGLPRKPGMSRMDLLEVNAKIIKQVTREIAERSPDEMTTLAAEVSGFPRNRVIGQAGMLDSARFAHFISEETGTDVLDIHAVTLGSHGATMVPAPSLCRVGSLPLTEVLDAATIKDLVERVRNAGAEIVSLLKTGSAYYAPSAAAAAMARAVVQDTRTEMPVCAWLTGEYGISDVYVGVIARLGKGGVEKVIELSLTDDELQALRAAGDAVKAMVADLELVDF